MTKPGFWREILLRTSISIGVAFLAYLVWGYSYGILTNEYHVPIVQKASGALTFHGDAMAATLDGYASPLWLAVSRLVGFFPIHSVFFVGFLLARTVFAWSIGSLASTMGRTPAEARAAWILGALSTLAFGWMIALPVGGDPVQGPYFSQTFLSAGLLVLSIALALRGNLVGSGGVLGLAFDINIMQSVLACGIIGILWLAAVLPLRRDSLLALGKAVGICAVVALPGLSLTVHSLLSSTGSAFWEGQKLSGWARFWLEGHFFATGRPLSRILAMAAILCTPAMLALKGVETRQRRVLVVLAVLVPALLASVELLVAGGFPSRVLFQLHLFRSDVLAYAVSVGLAVGLLGRALPNRKGELVANAGLPILLLSGALAQAAALAFSILFMGEQDRRWKSAMRWLSLLVAIGLGIWSLVSGVKVSGAILIVSGLSLVLPVLSRGSVAKMAAIALLLIAIQANFGFWKKEWIGKNFAAKFGESSPHAQQLRAFGNSTPSNAVFLLPPSVNARAFLERGVWFNFYDGASFLWRKGAEIQTLERMDVLGIRFKPGANVDLDTLDTQWYAGLCESLPKVAKAGVTHVVLPNSHDKAAPWSLHDPASAMVSLGCRQDTLASIQ